MHDRYLYARAGLRVARYHTTPTLHPESVGHHSAGVAALIWLLTRGSASGALMASAIFHDVHEQQTGDIPATAKWAWPGLNQVSKDIEFHYESTGPIPPLVLTASEEAMLKFADMADLIYKCIEEYRMGNREMRIMASRGLQVLKKRYYDAVIDAFLPHRDAMNTFLQDIENYVERSHL